MTARIMSSLKFKLKKGTVVLLLLATVIGQVPFFYSKPQQAEALFGVGDITFNTEVFNWYDVMKDIGLGALMRIAQNYVNQQLTRYLDQIVAKYKIRNYLYYDQVLTSNYLLNYLRDKVGDPDLRRLLLTTQRELISFDHSAYTPEQRRSLVLRFKSDLDRMYKNQTGIDPALITDPPADMSNEAYLMNARAYFFNPPSNLESRLVAQLMSMASDASAASAAEIAAGDGNKSSREALESNAPTIGANGEQTYLQIRDAIANPGSFVKDFTQEILNGIISANFSSDNPFTAIGAAVGDFLWSKFNLGNNGSVYNEYSYSYVGLEYDIPGSGENGTEVDDDGDGFPDRLTARPGGLPDQCYHGNDGGTPPTCLGSATVGSSAYFNTLCRALTRMEDSTANFLEFITINQGQVNGDNFREEGHADVWGRKALEVTSAMDNLQQALDQYDQLAFDQMMLDNSGYATYMNKVVRSLIADGNDLDLAKIGDGGGGIGSLISNTSAYHAHISAVQSDFGGERCSTSTTNATNAAARPEPPIVGMGSAGNGECADPGSTFANYDDALDNAMDAVVDENPGGIADQPNTTDNSRLFLSHVAEELREMGYEGTERVLNGHGNQGSGDIIAVWRDGDDVMERYDAINSVNGGLLIRHATQVDFTGDIPLECTW